MLIILMGPAEKIVQPGALGLLLLFLGLAVLKLLSEFRMFRRDGNELLVRGVFKKNRYLIENSVVAVTHTGREKTVGLYHPMRESQEIIGGLLTIACAQKNAMRLSSYLHIPYGETEMFKKLQNMK